MIEVLLVDDESYVTESLKKTIPWTSLGVRSIYTAASAAEALAVLEAQPIDILVTDIRMPETDGLELVRVAGERWPHVRKLLLSGYSDFAYAKKAIQLQVSGYILKPVDDDEFMRSIMGEIESLKDEWEEAERYHRLLYDLKTERQRLKENLMSDLLLGRQLSASAIEDKLRKYAVPVSAGSPAFMMLVQLGSHFADYDPQSVALMEYAVGNIAEEVLGPAYRVWHGKAPHDCLALLVAMNPDGPGGGVRPLREETGRLADEVGRQVRTYLKGDISIVISPWFEFPSGTAAVYRGALGALFQHGRQGERKVIFQEDILAARQPFRALDTLYKPPTLIHLLESKQWEAAEAKIVEAFGDLEAEKGAVTREHLYEVYLWVTNAFLYLAHRHGMLIQQIDEAGFDLFVDQSMVHSPERLRKWTADWLAKLKAELTGNDRHARSRLIQQVQELVTRDLALDLSVKTIAEKVYLHPVYLSKIYKSETGESLGDYLIRIRMERALYLLKHTNKKIYEITAELGYQNPQYFSKMFKKHYGMTPNEYRD